MGRPGRRMDAAQAVGYQYCRAATFNVAAEKNVFEPRIPVPSHGPYPVVLIDALKPVCVLPSGLPMLWATSLPAGQYQYVLRIHAG